MPAVLTTEAGRPDRCTLVGLPRRDDRPGRWVLLAGLRRLVAASPWCCSRAANCSARSTGETYTTAVPDPIDVTVYGMYAGANRGFLYDDC